MKNYKQLIKELPSRSVVFAFGRFNPPTTGHELLVQAVKVLAAKRKADHVIYASRSQDSKKNPLTVDKKVQYLRLMFPKTNFLAANDQVRTFLEAAKQLNTHYKNIIMVAGSDRVPEFKRLLTQYNGKEFHFDTIEVVSAGERDPDADDASGMSASKMRAIAVKGDYKEFKRGLPSTVRDIDGKRLMNDIRQGMGLEVVKEQIVLEKDELREQYYNGKIFNVGDIVESAGNQYTIVKRGTNHLLLKEETGNLVSKWITDVSLVQESQEMNEELTDKTIKVNTDKIKVARIIATMLGNDEAESSSSPDVLVNNALRKAKTKALNPEAIAIIGKMITLAGEVGIKIDQSALPSKLKEDAIKSSQKQKMVADLSSKQAEDRAKLFAAQKKEKEDLKQKFSEASDSPVVDKKTDYNLAKSIMRPSDFRKSVGAQKQEEEDTGVSKETESDIDADKHSVTSPTHTHVGGNHLGSGINHSLRRMKAHYHMGEEVEHLEELSNATLDSYKAAAKKSVDDLEAKGDYKKANDRTLNRMKATGKQIEKTTAGIKKALNKEEITLESYRSYHNNRTGFAKRPREDDEYHTPDPTTTHKTIHKVSHPDVEGGKQHNRTVTISNTTKSHAEAHAAAKAHLKSKGYTIHEEVEINEGAYEKAEENKKSADAAKKQGDMFAHHLHMADHHDNMAQWHGEKGRHGEADRHAAKSEEHHDKAMSLKESLDESMTDSWKKVQSMDKGSVTGGKEEAKKRHAYLTAVHDHHKKFGNDTKKVKGELEALNRSRLAEEQLEEADFHKQNLAKQELENKKRKGGVSGLEIAALKKKAGVNEENTVCLDDYVPELEVKTPADFADEEMMPESEIDEIVKSITDDEIVDEYEEDDFAVVDDETGEEIKTEEGDKLEESTQLQEVLSKMERMRAKLRFAKTKAKRERAAKIALKRHSSNDVVNKRARRLAIKAMKKRMLRGRDSATLSVAEKERIERFIQKRKNVINRIAMKMAPRVRQVEKARLSHTKFTKGSSGVSF